jgi:transcriptional regulator with XRE-family HTH domain
MIPKLFTARWFVPLFVYICLVKVDLLIEARKKRGYTQEFLAGELKIHRLTLASYERGDRHPPLDLFERWCVALGFVVLILDEKTFKA